MTTQRKRLVMCATFTGDPPFKSLHLFMTVYNTGRIEYYGHVRYPHSNRPQGSEGTRQVPYRALNDRGGYGHIAQGPAYEKLKASVARKIARAKTYNPPVLTRIQPGGTRQGT